MNNIYNSLKLFGYTLNESPNGYFIAQRPDGSNCLFDEKGKVVIRNANGIEYINDFYYCVTDNSNKDKAILYDKYGTIIDKAYYHDICNISSFIQVRHVDTNGNTMYNLYEKDGKAQFKNLYGEGYKIIKDDNNYKLVYRDDDNVFVVDSNNMKHTKLKVNGKQIVAINSHYILALTDDFERQVVIDYNNNVVIEGQTLKIDTTTLQSNNIIEVSDNYVNLIDGKGSVIHRIPSNIHYNINTVIFTSAPGVLCVRTFEEEFLLLNITTGKQSKKYKYIDDELFFGKYVGKDTGIELIDRRTFEVTSRIDKILSWYTAYNKIIVRKGENVEHYTLDFRPLVHEFD